MLPGGVIMCGICVGTVLSGCWAITGATANATEITNEAGSSKLFIEHLH
jgi:hypothetical protein